MLRPISSALLLLLAVAVSSSNAQFRPPSIIGITHIVRYQNTACTNSDQESGTCLADAECGRRAGTNIGTCANGYGTCCSFKVSPVKELTPMESCRSQRPTASARVERTRI